MVHIATDRLRKVFDQVVAVDDLTLEVAPGEFLALLGPSGCGKSTILRLVAGLIPPTSGRVLLDGQAVDDQVRRQHRMAMVFQDFALYPHLTVGQNIGFPLRAGTGPVSGTAARVVEVAKELGIADLLDRRPDSLSGGEQQRVATARAIVRQPEAFLLDEPLSNLDAGLRARLRTEVAALARRLGVTTLYVTHDQIEAMTMADRVAVLRRGRLQQVGRPAEVYADPATAFVAALIGAPRIGLAQAAIYADTEKLVLDLGSQLLRLPRADPRLRSLADRHTQRITVALRAEALTPVPGDTAGPVLHGHIRDVQNLGHEALVHLDIGALPALFDEDIPRRVPDTAAPPVTKPATRRRFGLLRPARSRPAPTARTEYGFYPVYDPELPDDSPPAGDLVVRVPAPDRPRPGQPMTVAVDPDQLLLFDGQGDRIRFG
ncbi:ABC transporter ATP-binding protein [Micromonospora zhanjiangensis]|uniref:ABC transporter ATP-binding protein n=1 Tax=Micromonospora zhanjiangensis TaxID=1522057 RepID=A0ABV8KLN2_9ACTN